jgi:outer membrane usher protein
MRSSRLGRLASIALAGGSLALAAPAAAGIPAQGDHNLYLEVIVNGTPTGLIAAFQRRSDGGLAIAPGELREIGIVPDPKAVNAEGLIDLDHFAGLIYRYDAVAQVVRFDARDRVRAANVYDASAILRGGITPEAPQATASPGAVLNYLAFGSTGAAFSDVFSSLNSTGTAGVALDGRIFGPVGVFSQSGIISAGAAVPAGWLRLDTTWNYSDPLSMVSYRAGDVISGGLTWSRSVRLGGVQFQRSFSLRPDLVTLPMPRVSGTAAVPSTVDVYVNNIRTFSQNVPTGPFEVNNLPIVSGAGTQRVVITDSLGRETVTSRPYYASAKLLREGLTDFSLETGYRRFNYGTDSNDYDNTPVASASVRHGIGDWLTVETHAETAGSLINGGIGAAAPLAGFGLASAAIAGSNEHAGTGALYAASIEVGYRNMTFYVRTARTVGDYRDAASIPSRFQLNNPGLGSLLPPKALDQAAFAIPLGFDPAMLTLSYTHLHDVDGNNYQLIGAGISRPIFGKASLYATAFADLGNRRNAGIFFGMSAKIGDGISAGANVSGGNTRVGGVDLIKNQPLEIGSNGWRLHDSEGATPVRSASASYRASFARLEAGADQIGGSSRVRAEAEGAVVLAGNGMFLANRVDDAFAVVDTGTPGVEVYYENRPVGTTDQRGYLLVPYLKSYERNTLTIDAKNLPVDADVQRTKEIVVPADRSGAVVQFGIKEAQSALVILRDARGAVLPPGSRGVVEPSGERFVVGYDGQAYMRDLAADNRIAVTRADGSECGARLTYAPRPGTRVEINGVCQ